MIKGIIIILFLIILISTSVVSIESVYSILIKRVNDKILLQDIIFVEGQVSDYLDQPEEGYTARIITFKEKNLFSYNFSAYKELIIEPGYDNLRNTHNESEDLILIEFPYYPNAKKIEIFDETGKLKLEIDLSSYARCNENDFCDFNENINNCAEDCREEIVIEKPKEQQEEETEEITPAAPQETIKEDTLLNQLEDKGISKNLLIIIAVLAIILILIIIISRKKENK